jgi:hypothetical protein
VQGAVRDGVLEAPIEIVGLPEGIRVDLDQRIERRAILVERLDPAQVLGDERAAGEAPCLHFRVDVGDGGLVHLKPLRPLPMEEGQGDEQQEENRESCLHGGYLNQDSR